MPAGTCSATSRNRWLYVAILALACSCASTPTVVPTSPPEKQSGPASLLIVGATVLDPIDKTARRREILVRGDRIVGLLPAKPANFSGKTLDATGRFVLPAFSDMHVHAWGNPSPQEGPDHACGISETARFMLYCGVVAFLDLGSNEARIFGLRARQRASKVPGADIYAAGSVIGHIADKTKRLQTTGAHSEDGPKRFRAAHDETSARNHVRALKKLQADVVKVLYDHTGSYMNMPRSVLAAIVDEARKLGLKTVVHIGTWKDAQDIVDVGANAITHLWDEDDIPPELAKKWAKKQIWSIPTQPVQVDLPNVLKKNGLLSHPLLQQVTTKKLRDDYRKTDGFVPKARFWMRYQGPHAGKYERQLKTLWQAGVPLMAGSDSGNFGVFQGFSLHRELALMVRAGVPIWDVLAAATVQPGRFLGRKFGVRVGDEASLVVLKRDPSKDIGATTAIEAVIQRGVVVDRAALLRGTTVDKQAQETTEKASHTAQGQDQTK